MKTKHETVNGHQTPKSKILMKPQSWSGKFKTEGPHFQGHVWDDDTGESVAVTYHDPKAEKMRLIVLAPKMLATLQEIAERGPVPGSNGKALKLRLVASQCIAREVLDAFANP